jgi:prepilin-type N-terminal cleavage/methylation domain-containing protein
LDFQTLWWQALIMFSSFPRARRAFTVIELLTVIAIIAILMALLLPALNAAKNAAKKAQAKTDGQSLANAVMSFYHDYGAYPLNQSNAKGGLDGWDTCYGNPPPELYTTADLCDILRAIPDTNFNQNNQLNPRQQVYFEPAMAKGGTSPHGGLVTVSGAKEPTGGSVPYGGYVDPWGMEYVVFIDSNYDGSLSTLTPEENLEGATSAAMSWFYNPPVPVVNCGCAAVSLGPDSNWGTAGNGIFQGSDDIATWQ